MLHVCHKIWRSDEASVFGKRHVLEWHVGMDYDLAIYTYIYIPISKTQQANFAVYWITHE
jgi:hypothetical protein